MCFSAAAIVGDSFSAPKGVTWLKSQNSGIRVTSSNAEQVPLLHNGLMKSIHVHLLHVIASYFLWALTAARRAL